MVVRDWAPQLEILWHFAVSVFLSHYGWKSVLESLSRAVPILGWPTAAEQFYNCKLLEEEVGICVEVARGKSCEVKCHDIGEKIALVMEETKKGIAISMRKKAGYVRDVTRDAVKDEPLLLSFDPPFQKHAYWLPDGEQMMPKPKEEQEVRKAVIRKESLKVEPPTAQHSLHSLLTTRLYYTLLHYSSLHSGGKLHYTTGNHTTGMGATGRKMGATGTLEESLSPGRNHSLKAAPTPLYCCREFSCLLLFSIPFSRVCLYVGSSSSRPRAPLTLYVDQSLAAIFSAVGRSLLTLDRELLLPRVLDMNVAAAVP
ncbi:uncharacterized protein LOC124824791 [Vigna umbellata]|uniref:uncharacterized protein LOC124824791 n=1 Tax=Vigna umbellata TaxID=87088 RepID=UPI001F5F9812|nr:uncharacterized protein LOC124824791 [Vigna umbellata]